MIFTWIRAERRTQVLLFLSVLTVAVITVACSGSGDDDPTQVPVPTGTAAVATATSQARATATGVARATATSNAGRPSTPSVTSTPTITSTSPTDSTPTPANTPTPTATPVPPNGIAVAGDDIDTRRGNFIGLNGSGSSDPDGDRLTYTWTQVHGPDVTGGAGRFVGPTPSFAVPNQVSTLIFDLTVNDGTGESTPDRVRVNVFEHVGNPGLFVDGNSGSNDTGDGTRERPFASIGYAISRISGPEQDIHVMTLANGEAYEETETLSPPVTASLYGGYGPGWVRDVENMKTPVNAPAVAVRFRVVDEEAWLSGFDITGAHATEPGQSTFAVRVDAGGATLFIEDNILRSGNAANGAIGTNAGSAYGVFVGQLFNVEIRRNEITAGNGGNGVSGSRGADGIAATTNGKNGSGGTGGAGGKGGTSSINGGAGGKGGSGLIPVDGSGGGKGGGSNGGAGGNGDPVGTGRVGDGKGGGGGAGGNGGAGGSGAGIFDVQSGLFTPGNGTNGGNAGNGGGGGGGGGGAGGVGLTGGAGGGGGGGGTGGRGGVAGSGGGASVGLLLFNPVSATVDDNTITAGNGGNGGNGGGGGTGGAGTAGGVGAPNECSFLGCDFGRSGDGGEGGGGGKGGNGGQGGGGAGGPSFGIVVGAGLAPSISDSAVTSGTGGRAGSGSTRGLGGSPGNNGTSSGGSGGSDTVADTAGSNGSGGDGGWSYAIFDMSPVDAAVPALFRNNLEAGTPGTGAGISGLPGRSGESNIP